MIVGMSNFQLIMCSDVTQNINIIYCFDMNSDTRSKVDNYGCAIICLCIGELFHFLSAFGRSAHKF